MRGEWAIRAATVLLVGLLAVGCTGPEQPGAKPGDSGQQEPAASTPPKDDPAAVAALEKLGAELTSKDGVVVGVVLPSTAVDDDLKHLAGLPSLQTLSAEVRGVHDAGLALLKGHPGLKTLKLEQSEVTNAGMEHLQALPKLEEIDLKKANISAEGYAALAKIPTLKRIRAPQTNFDDGCLEAISSMAQLELLDLNDCNRISPAKMALFANFTKLRSLKIWGPEVKDEALAAIGKLENLRALGLEQSRITKAGLEHLQGCKQLRELNLYGAVTVDSPALEPLGKLSSLEKLELRATALNDQGMPFLAGLSKLVLLDLSETAAGNQGMEVVAGLSKLEDLNLWNSAVEDAGLAHLSKLKSLKRLNLDKIYLTDAGLAHLKGLENLEYLHLGNTMVSDAGLPELSGLKSLNHLVLTFCISITDEGVEMLQKALPKLKTIER